MWNPLIRQRTTAAPEIRGYIMIVYTLIPNSIAWLIILFKFNQYYSIPSLPVKVPQFWHSRSTIVVLILVYIGFKWGGSSIPVQQ
jgi:hypothetical protein